VVCKRRKERSSYEGKGFIEVLAVGETAISDQASF
jgi:hypothetical protein